MKTVEWTDDDGYKHKSVVRDNDDPHVALEGMGMSQDPPDVTRIDWERVKRDLHNQLVVRGLVASSDVEAQQNGVTGAVLAALRPQVLDLYRR